MPVGNASTVPLYDRAHDAHLPPEHLLSNHMDSLADLRAKRERLRPEANILANKPDLTRGEDERLGNLVVALQKIDADIEVLVSGRREQIEAIRNATVGGTGDGPANGATGYRPDQFGANLNRGFDPWDDAEVSRFGSVDVMGRPGGDALKTRALAAIERADFTGRDDVNIDATKQHATQVIEELCRNGDPSIAEWATAVSDPAYRTAFRKVIRAPQHYQMLLDDRERAAFARTLQGNVARMHGDNMADSMAERTALTLSGASVLLPLALDPSIILTNAGTQNPFRLISDVRQTSQNVYHMVSSAGVTAEWLAEGVEVADATPTVAGPTITCAKGSAWIQATYEAYEDSNIDQDIARLLVDARDNLESTAFAVGSGSGQPLGIVTALGLVTASRVSGTSLSGGIQSTGDLVIGDIYAVDAALDARWSNNASWVAHKAIFNKIRRFGEGATGTNSAFWTDLGAGQPSTLIGYPTYRSSAMDSSVVSGSTDDVLILGDFRRGFVIADRIGMSVAFEPLVKGAAFRPTGHVGWWAHWRVGSAEVTGGAAFRMLRL